MPAVRNVQLSVQDRRNRGEDPWETYKKKYLKPELETPITPLSTPNSSSSLPPPSSWLSTIPSHSHRLLPEPEPDHIPRPPNAFFLFRSNLYKTQKHHLGEDQANISRIAGQRWKDLTELEREPYRIRAKHEKQLHARRHPGYKYLAGGCRTEKKMGKKGGGDGKESHERCRKVAVLLTQGIEGADLKRAVKSLDEEASTLSASSASPSLFPGPSSEKTSSCVGIESTPTQDPYFFDHSGSHSTGNFVPTSLIPRFELSAKIEEDAGDIPHRQKQLPRYDFVDTQVGSESDVAPFVWETSSPSPAENVAIKDLSIVHAPSPRYEFEPLINGIDHVGDPPTSQTTAVEPIRDFDESEFSQYINYDYF